MQRLRVDHGEEWGVLQVFELREYEWVFVGAFLLFLVKAA